MSDSEKLLTAEELDACRNIVASDTGLASQRAAALLAIDGGATRVQTSEQTGLTAGQVGYLLRTFRKKHLAMFPDIAPDEAQPPAEAPEPKKEASEPEEEKEEKAEKPKKSKKPKGKKPKGKKPKGKKAKKPKKGKAAKKKKAKKRKT